MIDLPSIFNAAGDFAEPDAAALETLQPGDRERLDVVRQCAAVVRDTRQAVDEITARLTATVKEVQELEALRVKLYGPLSYHSLWLENFGRR